MDLDLKTIKKYAIYQFVFNIFFAGLSVKIMVGEGVDIQELLSWVSLLIVIGLLITVMAKRKVIDYLVCLPIVTVLVTPIMYVGINQLISPFFILLNAFGFWFIHNALITLEKKAEEEESKENDRESER